MKEFIEKLKQIRRDVDFENEKELIDSGLLVSFDIICIKAMIQEEYGVKIPASKMRPCNFNSADAMWNLIQDILEDE